MQIHAENFSFPTLFLWQFVKTDWIFKFICAMFTLPIVYVIWKYAKRQNFFKPGNDVNYLIETFPLNTAI